MLKIAKTDSLLLKFKWLWKDKKLYILEELPLFTHGQVIGKLTAPVVRCSTQINIASASRVHGPNWLREPDGAAYPDTTPNPGAAHPNSADPEGHPWPTVIFEVGVSQSLLDLHNAAQDYLTNPNSTIRLVVVVKIYPKRTNGTRAMVALSYSHANPAQPITAISFGTAPLAPPSRNYINWLGGAAVQAGAPGCNAIGQAAFQLMIPSATLFHGAPGGVPGGVPAMIAIDLYSVQQIALK